MAKKKPVVKKIPAKVLKYLEKAGVKHEILEHKTVYSAIDAAATLGKKIDKITKSLVVKADRDYYLVLLPADNELKFDKLAKVIGKHRKKDVKVVKIPGEKVVENALKVKAGAISAFGELHKVAVVLDKKLEKAGKTILASGSNKHSIEMAIKDFIKLEEPVLGSVSVKKKIKTAKKVVKKATKAAKKTIAKKKPTIKKAINKVAKEVVKKTATKKTAKKTVKKAPVKTIKKTVKKVTKKSATKKASTKKKITGKTPVKKKSIKRVKK